jgi:hypothetical protein
MNGDTNATDPKQNPGGEIRRGFSFCMEPVQQIAFPSKSLWKNQFALDIVRESAGLNPQN